MNVFLWSALLTLSSALAYFYYNDRMFRVLNIWLPGERQAGGGVRAAAFLVNFALFYVISLHDLPLVFNWSLIGLIFVAETKLIYRSVFPACLYAGLQSALVGLATNLACRSAAALITGLPLSAFDAHISGDGGNYKAFPVCVAFLLSGMLFGLVRRRFPVWPSVGEEAQRQHLRFGMAMAVGAYLFLVLNLLIYLLPEQSLFLTLWELKSGVSVLVCFYINLWQTYTLSALLLYEERNTVLRRDVDSRRLEKIRLEQAAFYDLLTGCRSRSFALEQLRARCAGETPFSLCFVDLNGLKLVNDQLGHAWGDAYLRTVAYVLTDTAEPGDLVARYGGDEFLLVSDASQAALAERMDAVNDLLGLLSHSDKRPYALSVSFGIVPSAAGSTPEALIALADEQMYRHKCSRRAPPPTT